MDARPVDQWTTILGKLPAPEGTNTEKLMARRIIGDLVGYNHPNGSERTRKRREIDADRDSQEIANGMIAYARMMFDAGVRP